MSMSRNVLVSSKKGMRYWKFNILNFFLIGGMFRSNEISDTHSSFPSLIPTVSYSFFEKHVGR
jgi:hypothetical protein